MNETMLEIINKALFEGAYHLYDEQDIDRVRSLCREAMGQMYMTEKKVLVGEDITTKIADIRQTVFSLEKSIESLQDAVAVYRLTSTTMDN